MPSSQNAKAIVENSEVIAHLKDIGMMYGFPVLIIMGLLVWAWKRMERTQDKLEKTVITHIEENDKTNDEQFKLIRATDEKLNILIGEHRGIQAGGSK